jgi:hypothetical protein
MDKINGAIVSFFMNNVDKKTVDIQRKVVEKFNKSKYPHYSMLTDMRHGASMDIVWAFNGQQNGTFAGQTIPKKFDHDVIFFLDIDAIPLNENAIDDVINKAANGWLYGNVQRSNHIQNNQHLFVAPSCLALSVDSYLTIKKPSGLETPRADVAEEYTYAAEKSGIVPVDYYMPICYDSPPSEGGSWALKDGMPVYGRGTTFGAHGLPMFWHSFQIFHPGSQENFWKKCETVLNDNESK